MKLLQALSTLVIAFAVTLAAPASSLLAQDATPGGAGEYDRTGWPEELDCGLFGGDDAEATLASNEPLATYLEERLGVQVNYTTGTSYNAVIESMRAGHTNCGTVGPFSYLLAVEEAGAEALVVEVYPGESEGTVVYDPDITPSYYSVISVKKGSGIASVADLPGRSFAFVDPASTSGHLIPRHVLLAAGINTDEDLETIFAGSHPTAAIALWNDKVDAAATTEATLYNLAAEGQIDLCGFEDGRLGIPRAAEDIQALYENCPDGSIVPIAFSEPIPNTPFAVHKDLPASLKQAIYDALLDIKNNPELIAELGYWFTDPNVDYDLGLDHIDSYYDPLRVVATELDLDLSSFGE